MTDLDLAFAPAVDLAQMIAARTVSPVEVISNSLSRIDEVNQKLNCFCFIWHDEALEAARVATQAVARGDPLGPLHGIPVVIKDQADVKGMPTTLGSVLFKNYFPDRDSFVAEKLRNAGAIILAKATLGELGGGDTHGSLFGSTRNPYDPDRTVGGSSGGAQGLHQLARNHECQSRA